LKDNANGNNLTRKVDKWPLRTRSFQQSQKEERDLQTLGKQSDLARTQGKKNFQGGFRWQIQRNLA
jgi:hypothetical protein